MAQMHNGHCQRCGAAYTKRRADLGYSTCLPCGEKQAREVRHTIMPAYSKGAYQLISRADVAHTNPKR